MDITYRTHQGILEVEPTGRLEESEFSSLADQIESIDGQELNGILIHTQDFPGYRTISDMLAHVEFVNAYGNKVKKVALCTDSRVGRLLSLIGRAFVDAAVKEFAYDERDEAEEWLLN